MPKPVNGTRRAENDQQMLDLVGVLRFLLMHHDTLIRCAACGTWRQRSRCDQCELTLGRVLRLREIRART